MLTMSFGLHAVQVDHHHPGHSHHHGDEVNIYDLSGLLHAADKKWILFLILLLVLSGGMACIGRVTELGALLSKRMTECIEINVKDPIRVAFKKGIVQSLVYG